jgi:hypothetical protein
MPVINSLFSNWDRKIFVVAEFNVSSEVKYWDRYQFQLQRQISKALSFVTQIKDPYTGLRQPSVFAERTEKHVAQVISGIDFSYVFNSLKELDFVVSSEPGLVRCKFTDSKTPGDDTYRYVIARGAHRNNLSIDEVLYAPNSEANFEVLVSNCEAVV